MKVCSVNCTSNNVEVLPMKEKDNRELTASHLLKEDDRYGLPELYHNTLRTQEGAVPQT